LDKFAGIRKSRAHRLREPRYGHRLPCGSCGHIPRRYPRRPNAAKRCAGGPICTSNVPYYTLFAIGVPIQVISVQNRYTSQELRQIATTHFVGKQVPKAVLFHSPRHSLSASERVANAVPPRASGQHRSSWNKSTVLTPVPLGQTTEAADGNPHPARPIAAKLPRLSDIAKTVETTEVSD
jgi:hypothetical protein